MWIISEVLTHGRKTKTIHSPAPAPAILPFIIQAKKMSGIHLTIEFTSMLCAHHNYKAPPVESVHKIYLPIETNLLIKFFL